MVYEVKNYEHGSDWLLDEVVRRHFVKFRGLADVYVLLSSILTALPGEDDLREVCSLASKLCA